MKLAKLFDRGTAARVDLLVVGLGNPGDGYANTRHNVGFQVANRLAKRARAEFGIKSAESRIAEGTLGTQRIAIARPQTFMNDSGKAVRKLLDRYRIEPSSMLDLAEYVLSPFTADERAEADKAIARAAEAAEVVTRDGLRRAMDQFNG